MEMTAGPEASNHRRALAALVGVGLGLLFFSPLMLHCMFLDLSDDCDDFGWFAFAQGGVYAVGVWLVLRHAWSRSALLVILVVGIVARLIAVPSPTTMSTDIYRYVWDGRVQAAGINPYRYIPNDEHLTALRDEAIYPHINRRDRAPTIYPPVAQMIFLAVTRISESLTAMKIAMLGFDIVTMLAIIAIVRREGSAPERVLIYAWHPLPIWEFSGAGHIDSAAVALMCVAFALTQSGRRVVAGAALALSTLVKPFALVITPALWRPWDWRMPLAFVTTAMVCYLPYLGVGARVLGYSQGYGDEEGYHDGRGFFLVRLLRSLDLPSPSAVAYMLAALAVLSALAALVAFRHRPKSAVETTAPILLATTFTVLLSPHYAWYFAWVLPFLCRYVYVPLLYVTLASFAFYLSEVIGYYADYRAGIVLYGGFVILAVVDLWSRSRRSPVRRTA